MAMLRIFMGGWLDNAGSQRVANHDDGGLGKNAARKKPSQ
jgi:hypothetical protein